MKIPILTYHSLRGPGNDYAANDHVALETDLRLIHHLGIKVVDLRLIVDHFSNGMDIETLSSPCVAITFDDGTDYDFFDFYHPEVGYFKSFFNIIVNSEAFHSFIGDAFATSFVIASPQARTVLDQRCISGNDQWRDNWWLPAARSGVLQIANHSWDHVHPLLPNVAQENQEKGSFLKITRREDAELQIIHAQDYIESKIGELALKAFAYPYGDVNEFLSRNFLPNVSQRISAAFTTSGTHVTCDSCRWTLPRFVCGHHWKSPADLETILIGP